MRCDDVVQIRLISKEEAQQTRKPKEPGVRLRRMSEFDEYARSLIENPGEAVVYEGIEEAPQKFVLSLRGAFKRAKLPATVRKMRGRDEVRAWVAEQAPASRSEPAAKPGTRGRRKAV